MTANGDPSVLEDQQRRSIKITKRTDRSMYMFLLQHLLKPFGALLIKQSGESAPGSQKLEPHKKALKRCEIQERQEEGIWVYDMVPRGTLPGKGRTRRIYYFAGGGWSSPPASEHWVLCAEMANRLPDTIVTVVSYPLAPHSPAPVAIPQLMAWYHAALHDAEAAGERVIFAGDSAGGNIILCLPLLALLEDPDAPCPVALMGLSPSTDLSRSNPDIRTVAKHDPILRIPFINGTAKKWRAEWDATDPRVSPLYADISPLARRGVKVHGVVGGYDILGPDANLFREKCNKAGVHGEWLEWDKQMHVFPLTWAYKLPEGVAAKEWTLDVLRNT
ncbi:hypothetical protein LTR53_016138 [Teratosphaeriaceae sp. CCFEE 6253]|nr:hypothetical protein LTR53_016138 [Teratosphaeriaceae sp. CCFEE 6253]